MRGPRGDWKRAEAEDHLKDSDCNTIEDRCPVRPDCGGEGDENYPCCWDTLEVVKGEDNEEERIRRTENGEDEPDDLEGEGNHSQIV